MMSAAIISEAARHLTAVGGLRPKRLLPPWPLTSVNSFKVVLQSVADLLLLLAIHGTAALGGHEPALGAVDLKDHTLTIHETKNREPLTLPLSTFLTDWYVATHTSASESQTARTVYVLRPISSSKPCINCLSA